MPPMRKFRICIIITQHTFASAYISSQYISVITGVDLGRATTLKTDDINEVPFISNLWFMKANILLTAF